MSFGQAPRQPSRRKDRTLRLESLESRSLLSVNPLVPSINDFLASHALPALVGKAASGKTAKATVGASTKVIDDYGNTMDTASRLSLATDGSASASGKINYTADVDMFSLVANGTGSLTVTLAGISGKTGVIPQLAIYDSTGTLLATKSGTSTSKKISSSLDVAAGTYYVKATGVSSSTGGYTLQVNLVLPTPTPDPSPTPSPNPTPSPTPPAFLPDSTAYVAGTAVTQQLLDTGSGRVLLILGTDAADAITLSQSGSSITIVAGATSQTVTDTLAGIVVYGFGGDDTIRLDSTIAETLVTVVYAGAGNDAAYEAGSDLAYLYGQDGNDRLISVGGKADVLYGGAGLDTFWCDSSDLVSDVEASETAATSVHKITAFAQPTTDPTKAVSLEIAGQDIVDPTAAYAYTNNFVNKPLWVDGPQFNDIKQGQAADCYFLAGLSALADTDPGLLQQSITALGDGTYAVRFYKAGSEVYYRMDGQLPTSGSLPWYAKLSPSGELWVALLEKAFAQFRYGTNAYTSIDSGTLSETYRAITGASGSYSGTAGLSTDILAQNMANSLAAGHAVIAGSNSSTAAPIVGSHAYNVHAVVFENNLWYVTVYNPWGFDGASYDSNSGDGLLKLTASQFQSSFGTIQTCNA